VGSILKIRLWLLNKLCTRSKLSNRLFTIKMKNYFLCILINKSQVPWQLQTLIPFHLKFSVTRKKKKQSSTPHKFHGSFMSPQLLWSSPSSLLQFIFFIFSLSFFIFFIFLFSKREMLQHTNLYIYQHWRFCYGCWQKAFYGVLRGGYRLQLSVAYDEGIAYNVVHSYILFPGFFHISK